MPPDQTDKRQAIQMLGEGAQRFRTEFREIVRTLIPVILGILGATFTISSTEFVSVKIDSYSLQTLILGVSFLAASFVTGVLYLFFESAKHNRDNFAAALKKVEDSEADGKSTNWWLARAELVARRSIGKWAGTEDEVRNRFRTAFDVEKNNLSAWKTVKHPRLFYSTIDAHIEASLKSVFFALLVIGGGAIFYFFVQILMFQGL